MAGESLCGEENRERDARSVFSSHQGWVTIAQDPLDEAGYIQACDLAWVGLLLYWPGSEIITDEALMTHFREKKKKEEVKNI